MDDVFRALSDPSRRRLLDSLNRRNGQTLRELCAGLDMARQSVSKHLAILEDANLVITVRRGREKLHYLNAAPINDIAERWINRYDQQRVAALSDLKKALAVLGYEENRQTGSHIRMTTRMRGVHHVTVPDNKVLPLGTLMSILRDVARHFECTPDEILSRLLG